VLVLVLERVLEQPLELELAQEREQALVQL
jgi:hypothetical protein